MVQLFWGQFFDYVLIPFETSNFDHFLFTSFSCRPFLIHFLFNPDLFPIHFLYIHFLCISYSFPIQFVCISYSILIYLLFNSYSFPIHFFYISFSCSFISFHFLWPEKFIKIPKSMDMFPLSISYFKNYSSQAPNQLGKVVPHKSQKKNNKGIVNKVLGLDG